MLQRNATWELNKNCNIKDASSQGSMTTLCSKNSENLLMATLNQYSHIKKNISLTSASSLGRSSSYFFSSLPLPASPLGPSANILTTPLSQEGPSPMAGLSTDGAGESVKDFWTALDRFDEFDIDDWDCVGEGGEELSSSSSDSGDIGRQGWLKTSSSLGSTGLSAK